MQLNYQVYNISVFRITVILNVVHISKYPLVIAYACLILWNKNFYIDMHCSILG